jgi:hypothetical protein
VVVNSGLNVNRVVLKSELFKLRPVVAIVGVSSGEQDDLRVTFQQGINDESCVVLGQIFRCGNFVQIV